MDSLIVIGIVLGAVVLWKIVTFLYSAASNKPLRPRNQALEPSVVKTETIAPTPARVSPQISIPVLTPRVRSFQDVPKTNRYGELED